MRVLGLFDGIGTGYLVLKELGLEVERYMASEVNPEAISVSRVHHHDIIHVGDICKITDEQVWLIIGCFAIFSNGVFFFFFR